MKTRATSPWVVACLLAAIPSWAWAGPLLTEQNAGAAGLAGAATARVLGPSSLFYNPALLCDVPGISVDIGGALVVPVTARSSDPWSVRGWQPKAPTRETLPALETPPSVFAAYNTGHLSVGVGVFSPMVHHARWPEVESLTRPLVVNPVVAYRQGGVSFGVGLVGGGLYQEYAGPVTTEDGSVRTLRTRGLGLGVGVNAGLLLVANRWLTVGANYRSRMLLGVAQQGTLDDKTAFSLSDQVLPDTFTTGLSVTPHPMTVVSADAMVVLWSGLQEGVTRFSDGGQSAVSRRWRDSFGVRVGVEQALFFLAPDVKARAGLLWDSSPVVDGRLQADQPWSDRAGLALGMGWKVFGVTLDAAYVGDVTVPRRGEDRSTYASTTQMLVFTVGYRHAR